MAPTLGSSPTQPSWWPSSVPFPEAANSQTALAIGAALVGGTSALAAARIHRRFLRRYPNVNALPHDIFVKKRWIRGVVTSVGDADNFRLYHTPGPFWNWPLKFRRVPATPKELKDQTLHIRLAGVDAPEGAHFGKQAMPYSGEALSWLQTTVNGRVVYCQLLSRDQYSRVVSIATLAPRLLPGWLFTGRNVSLEMLKAGWATTYEQAGAEYGKKTREQFLLVEAQAKADKRGMWQHGSKGETPAEYKRRHRTAEEEEPAAKTSTATTKRNSDNVNGTSRVKANPKPWWWPF
ncbi:SNase-domain-containing protein [Auriculariales sp. MPI-PUGE-AT-0066]|nr:SNase-domain-containing protein [Auriculariales sp. MPI-PUGE-AT-0066]